MTCVACTYRPPRPPGKALRPLRVASDARSSADSRTRPGHSPVNALGAGLVCVPASRTRPGRVPTCPPTPAFRLVPATFHRISPQAILGAPDPTTPTCPRLKRPATRSIRPRYRLLAYLEAYAMDRRAHDRRGRYQGEKAEPRAPPMGTYTPRISALEATRSPRERLGPAPRSCGRGPKGPSHRALPRSTAPMFAVRARDRRPSRR
jgi:hypothetical protein